MDFGNKDMNDFFGGIFGGQPYISEGDEVTALLPNYTSVRGILVSKPTVLNQYCVVNGTLTPKGKKPEHSSFILVPLNLLKAK